MTIYKVLLPLTCFFLLAMLILQSIGFSWSHQVLFEHCQDKKTYNSFGPYCLYVVRKRKTLNYENHMRIVKSAENDPNGYGLQINFFTNSYDPFVEGQELKNATVDWQDEGVTLTVPNRGHGLKEDVSPNSYSIFIPKEDFIGGR